MAYEDVTVPEDSLGSGGKFFNFSKGIGETVEGFFVKSGKSSSKYAKEGDKSWTFLVKDNTTAPAQMVLITMDPPPTHLAASLEAAEREGKLVQGKKCKMAHTKDLPTDKGNPMKVCRLQIDSEAVTEPVIALIKSKLTAPPPKPSTPAPASDDPFAL